MSARKRKIFLYSGRPGVAPKLFYATLDAVIRKALG